MPDTSAALVAARDEIVRLSGPWTAHRIRLGDDVYTIDEPNGFDLRVDAFIRYVSYFVRKPMAQVKALDLACLEGGFALEMARRGATAVGIEGREQSLVKALFAARVAGLESARFFLDDVRNLSREKYGSFDITFCNGILYHLDAPDVFEFVAKVADVTTSVALIDTHITGTPNRRETWRGKEYAGQSVGEHDPSTTLEQRKASGWASLDNPLSFWLTLRSLVSLLYDVGFADVLLADWANLYGANRLQVLAIKPAP